MEYVAVVMSYVLEWWSTTRLQLGSVMIPSIFGFLVAVWIFKNALDLIREYIFDEVI